MSALYMVRIPVVIPRLLRFAFEQDIRQEEEGLGYSLHVWLAALFGRAAPKPFRFFERTSELLAYSPLSHTELLERAQAFAPALAWSALEAEGAASKPMPACWRVGQRLRAEALVCPVSRVDNDEKDVYLRALDRQGAQAAPRAAVYSQWFIAQWKGAVHFEHVQLLGMTSRSRMLRRARNGANRLRVVERPQALFGADVEIADPERFAALLARGIGRHRAFGFGMILLSPRP